MNKQNLGLLLAIVGGYFLWKKNQAKKVATVAAASLVAEDEVIDVDDYRLTDQDENNVNIFGSYGCRN